MLDQRRADSATLVSLEHRKAVKPSALRSEVEFGRTHMDKAELTALRNAIDLGFPPVAGER